MRCDDACRDYMYDFIKKICEEIGPRSSATPEEHEGLRLIEEELKSFSDETFRDDFECHPGSYPRGFVRILLIALTASYIMYLFSPVITLIIIAVGLLLVFLQFFLLKEATDFLYKKKKSWNVFGKIKPTEETRKLVILGGHSDSAFELRWFKRFRAKIVRWTFGAIGAIAVLPVLTVIKMIGRGFSFAFADPIVSYGIFQIKYKR